MPSSPENSDGVHPYEHLSESDRNWEYIFESDPYTCWNHLVDLFSAMNSEELELQREAFRKSRMQAEEIGKTSNHAEKDAMNDIFEFLLLCERAANTADPNEENI